MRIAFFYHSLVSDWNHGNAHFLRGVAAELLSRGHMVDIYEPANGWSFANLVREFGPEAVNKFHQNFPMLKSFYYNPWKPDLPRLLEGAKLVIVHEWNDPELVSEIGRIRKNGAGFKLFFHDTHHRLLSDPAFAALDLSGYDGVLAFGETLKNMYLERGLAGAAWTWHEAADTRIFKPLHPASVETRGDLAREDLVWIGNWGDGEREKELSEYLIKPSAALKLRAAAYGVRYPEQALSDLSRAGIDYRGWAPNYEVPNIFSRFKATVHIPRGPYAGELGGIPTIRVFEALACGIPLVCAPWADAEGLFNQGDYLLALNPARMKTHLKDVLNDPELAASLSASGLSTIQQRHTCAHRVDELLSIYAKVQPKARYACQA